VAHVGGVAGAVTGTEKGGQGVDDEQGGVHVRGDSAEDGGVAGQDDGATGSSAAGNGDEGGDAVGSATGGVNAGTDGIEEVIFGREEDDAARWGGLTAGKRLALGDAGGELAEEGAFAETGIAIEDSDLAEGKATRREPLDGFGGDVAEADDIADGRVAPGRWFVEVGIAGDEGVIMRLRRCAHGGEDVCRDALGSMVLFGG
jgi:hypothetical protein